MQVRLIAITQPIVDNIRNCEELIEYAGRKCTATTEKTGNNTAQFVKARVKQGHTSILEHVNFTFEIDGISRACLAQLTRHRLTSFSVESQRYCTQNKSYLIPQSIRDNPIAMQIYCDSSNFAKKSYDRLLYNGVPKEDARFLLTNGQTTNLVMTVNLREIKHIFDLRINDAAQWEIRELCEKMRDIVKEYCPNALN